MERDLRLRIQITGTETVEGHPGTKSFTTYIICVVSVTLNRKWNVRRRFQEFVDLRIKLAQQCPITQRLTFPPKKWVGSLAPEVVQARQIILQGFIQHVLLMSEAAKSSILMDFLEVDTQIPHQLRLNGAGGRSVPSITVARTAPKVTASSQGGATGAPAHTTSIEIIHRLGLRKFLDNAYYGEVEVHHAEVPSDDGLETSFTEVADMTSLTSGYILLPEETTLDFFVCDVEQVWHFYDGCPLLLLAIAPDGTRDRLLLGHDLAEGHCRQMHIKAGSAIACRPQSKSSFVFIGVSARGSISKLGQVELADPQALLAAFPASEDVISEFTMKSQPSTPQSSHARIDLTAALAADPNTTSL